MWLWLNPSYLWPTNLYLPSINASDTGNKTNFIPLSTWIYYNVNVYIQCLPSSSLEGVQDSIVWECDPGLFIPGPRFLNFIRCVDHGTVLWASEFDAPHTAGTGSLQYAIDCIYKGCGFICHRQCCLQQGKIQTCSSTFTAQLMI